ncbi:MAG: hypothetical protein QOJ88_378 [Pyrinomonadaceae bacterium]|jgi:hypothetical protein|nr:hypothetical protein [Pyrinomonadaceae bacterium]
MSDDFEELELVECRFAGLVFCVGSFVIQRISKTVPPTV